MRLPNVERCIVPEAKITRYLLYFEGDDNGDKARFFLAFGFIIEAWSIMADALKHHAQMYDVIEVIHNERGDKYLIEGELITPDKRNPYIRTVWMIDTGTEIPRFITAYPAKRKK